MKIQISFVLVIFLSLSNAHLFKRRKCIKKPRLPPPTFFDRPNYPFIPMLQRQFIPFQPFPQNNVPVDLKFFEIVGQPLWDNTQAVLPPSPVFPQTPDNKPVLPEIKPVLPEIKPVLPDIKPVLPEIKPIVPEIKPVIPDIGPIIDNSKPTRGDIPDVPIMGNPSAARSCSIQNDDCLMGEECVFIDNVRQTRYACPNIPSVSCVCQPGCRHGDLYIPFGESIVGDCGNKCTCMLYGTVSCEKKTC